MIDSLVFQCSNLHILSTPMHISDNFDDRTHHINVMWGRTYVRRRRARDVRRATERAQRAAEVATVSG